MSSIIKSVIILSITLVASGCTRYPQADNGQVSSIIATRIDKRVEWHQECFDDQINGSVQCLLENELTPDSAIQMALLNNPKIQAFFEELGIARADLIEAGLLSNPSFEIEVRYPHVRGLRTNIEYLITSSLLDIFLIPLRKRLAATEFEQTKLKVSDKILNLAFDVRIIFYELVLEMKKVNYTKSIVELTSINRDIISKQIRIGNVNALEFQLAESRFMEAELELSMSQAEIIRLKEKLNRFLGLTKDFYLILPEDLPQEIDCRGFDLCTLEAIALEERLDLQVARFEIARLSRLLGLKDWWTFTNLKGGLAGEREPNGANLIGYGFSGMLPIFNYGQAARIRLFAQLRQAQDRLTELQIQILSEIREAHKLLMNYLKIVNDYRNGLLPIQRKISVTSEELYNVMGMGLDRLLENKRQEVVANQNYTESMKKYLVAKVDLDRALGGYLSRLLTQRECIQGISE